MTGKNHFKEIMWCWLRKGEHVHVILKKKVLACQQDGTSRHNLIFERWGRVELPDQHVKSVPWSYSLSNLSHALLFRHSESVTGTLGVVKELRTLTIVCLFLAVLNLQWKHKTWTSDTLTLWPSATCSSSAAWQHWDRVWMTFKSSHYWRICHNFVGLTGIVSLIITLFKHHCLNKSYKVSQSKKEGCYSYPKDKRENNMQKDDSQWAMTTQPCDALNLIHFWKVNHILVYLTDA